MFNKLPITTVRKPARYTGGEYGAVIKDKNSISLRVAFCFPDTYEIGMSCLGLQVLYDVMNRMPNVWCERSFAPAEDMRELLLKTNTPLYALESGDALCDFDVLAFTLQYELCYTNVLNMLDLANIPLRCENRGDNHPLIIAGGPCAYNPEPMCDFIDLFIVGEGEDVTPELLNLIDDENNTPRDELLIKASKIKGVYVPSLYDVTYNPDKTIAAITPKNGAPAIIEKALVYDLDNMPFPERPIVPNIDIIHDRAMIELFRGCIRGCRFCQAGFTSRPVREKSADLLNRQAYSVVDFTGSSEIGMVSLSTSDYTGLPKLCDNILSWSEDEKVSLSLPSLRADSFSIELMQKAQKVRKTGLTFAPEAGTQRLRNVINKNLSETDLMTTLTNAFLAGWSGVKLYFMLGLPTERDEDVLGIAELCARVYYLWRQIVPDKSRGVRITASASLFVPKPHTPFQWEPMDSPESLERKASICAKSMRRQINFNWHEAKTSYIEGVLARGDRKLGRVIEQAYRLGQRMDSWSEHFSLDRWREAFEDIDPDFYALRRRNFDEILPWSHISTGVTMEHLIQECELAYKEQTTPDCRSVCSNCGCKGGVDCAN